MDMSKLPDPSSTEPALRSVLQRLAQAGTSSSEAIFRDLIRAAAETLGTDYAFIGELVPDMPDHARMLEFFADGGFAEGFVYSLAGTPCQNVINQDFRYYPSRIQDYFSDPHIRETHAEAYAAIPLYDSYGRGIGLMGVMSRGALPDEGLTRSVLCILSVRAAAELQRRDALAASRDSEASYRAILESTPDAVFVHDIESGAIVDVNAEACQRYGYSRDEMLKLDVGALSAGVSPYDQAHAAAHIARALAGEPVRIEWHARNKDGSLRWDEVVLNRTRIAGQDRVLAFTRDITDRKEREAALQKSEDRLRATVEAALDCVIVMDRHGSIVEFNPAAEECFGYRKDQVLGRSLAQTLIPERFRVAHTRGLEHYLVQGEGPYLGRRVEVTAMRANGAEFPAELAIDVAQGAEGTIFIGYLRDITERKQAEAERERLEDQLRQAQKMEAIGHLAGGIAHDFNNILTGVMGYIGMARERLESFPDDVMQRYMDRSRHAVERARDLIQQMLTFSRGQRGAPQAARLAPLVEHAVHLLESTLPSTVELHTKLAANLPPVLIDPVHLEQVLMNLCINARDAMGGRGRVEITLSRFDADELVCSSCRSVASGSYAALAVCDAGSGIDAKNLNRLFEPFFTTKEVGKGSGMGLAVVHGILHEHGGHILVDSTPGKGTAITVLFPLLEQVTELPAPQRTAAERVQGALRGHLLLVDDDSTVREYMQERLEQWGLQVCACANGADALARFEQDPAVFDAAILDHTMPKMTGIELARRIYLTRPDLPVLLYTGYGDMQLEQQAQSAGVHALLKKPVDTALLLRTLREVLPKS